MNIKLAALAALAFGAGAVVGIVVPVNEPAPEVRTQIVTEEVEVEVASPDCLEALTEAETGFDVAADGFASVAEMVDAMVDGDLVAMQAASSELGVSSDRIQPVVDRYNAAAAKCRARS